MEFRFADRTADVPRSFIREILKVTGDPSIISFAGGLPNPGLFPSGELAECTARIYQREPGTALQYSTTEGHPSLRRWIADRYKVTAGLTIDPANILITNGSQQALDLIGKVMLNDGESVAIEEPGYLGAIQAFSVFRPRFVPVPLCPDGICLDQFEKTIREVRPRVFYSVPSFQNPSGITYSAQVRERVAAVLDESDTLLVEDNPYGDLRFMGDSLPPIRSFMKKPSVILGSFSKIVAPAFRIGWLVACPDIMDKLVTVKQGADLHTNSFCQMVVSEFLDSYDINNHLLKINRFYKVQRDAMVEAIHEFFPDRVKCTEPEGGMFLWATLPDGISALDVFNRSIERKVAFVPGNPFYTRGGSVPTMRLNFTNSEPDTIRKGISILGNVIREFI